MFLVALGFILLAFGASGHQPPEKLGTYFYYFFDWLSEKHLRSMTRELLKDVEYKMRYAGHIFSTYGGKITPEADKIYSEVGYLQSSLMKKFRYMCAIYRQHTRLDEYIKETFNVDAMLNGNHLLQSAYHELLVLKDLQNIALDKQEALRKKERAMQFFMEFRLKERTATPKVSVMYGFISMPQWAAIIIVLFCKQCLSENSPDIQPLLNELSEQNQADLVNVSDAGYNRSHHDQTYKHIDSKAVLRQADPLLKILYAANAAAGNENVEKACYTIQITWRRAKRDMYRFFGLRDFYDNNYEYEIGYLTHVIISKYMNILELYGMVDYRFIQHPDKHYAPNAWVWYIYTNVLEYSRAIIHWCNMMHEIKRKYGMEAGPTPSADYDAVTMPDPEEMEVANFQKNLHERFQQQLQDAKKRKLESRMRFKMMKKNPSANLTTHRTRRPPQYWKWRPAGVKGGPGQDYGWSKEQW